MIFVKKNYQPLFSIVLTTYDRKKLIRRAINSLLNQSEKDWECIIVDDGSNDKSYIDLIQLCEADARFRYIFRRNGGQVTAKNIGIKNSSGAYITFLDSDDEYEKDHLLYRKILLNENPEIEFLFGGIKVIGDSYVPDLNDSSKMVALEDCFIGGTFFVKTQNLIDVGGFDPAEYGEDKLLFEKCKKAGLNIAETTFESYIYHREHEQSVTNEKK